MSELERSAARPGTTDSLLSWAALILLFLSYRTGNESIIGFGGIAIFTV